MKTPVKNFLRLSGLIITLLIACMLIFYLNFQHSIKTMKPAETALINDSVWCIRDQFVNAYVFKGKSSYLMIDAGISKKNFGRELTKMGIKPKLITAVFLTHTDGDHIGALSLFKNAAIYMSRDEEQMINGVSGKNKFFKTKWKNGPYTMIDDNDSLVIDGLSVKMLLTSGHTTGSCCYIVGSDYLVSGDNLTVRDGKYENFIEKFNMNTSLQSESIKKLPGPYSFRYILTGHSGIIKNEN